MKARRFGSWVIVTALAVVAAPAAADVRVVKERFAPPTGIALAGDELVWIRQDRDRRSLSVRAGSRELLRLDASEGAWVLGWPAGDAGHVAVQVTEHLPSSPYTTRERLLAFGGPLSGPLRLLAAPCVDDWLGVVWVDVGGSLVSYAGPGCGERSVEDLATGSRWPLPATADDPRLDGDWVAWHEPAGGPNARRVVARNLLTGQSYSVRVPVAPSDFDVDAGGRLVVLPPKTVTPARTGLLRASPAAPVLRGIDIGRPRSLTRVLVEDGVIAALGHDPQAPDRSLAGYVLTGDADGDALTRRGAGLDAAALVWGAFDVDGGRIAAQVRRCGHVLLIRADSAAELPHFGHAERCRLRLRARPWIEKGRRLRIAFSCAGYEVGCEAERLRATVGGRVVARLPETLFPVGARLRLTPLGRRLADRGELRRVRLSARLSDNVGVWPGRLHTTVAALPE